MRDSGPRLGAGKPTRVGFARLRGNYCRPWKIPGKEGRRPEYLGYFFLTALESHWGPDYTRLGQLSQL